MSANVAESAGAGDLGLQAPDQREIFIGNPILGVASAKMINAMADFTAIDHLLGQRDCRHAPVIVTNHIRDPRDRKSTRLNSSHVEISYAVFCLKKKNKKKKNK